MSQQVLMMADIYSNAASADLWLGLAFDGSNEAMHSICCIGKEFDYSPERVLAADHLALLRVIHIEYWSRLCIVQEILLRHSIIVRRGTESTSWKHQFKPAFVGMLPILRKACKTDISPHTPMLNLLLRIPVHHNT